MHAFVLGIEPTKKEGSIFFLFYGRPLCVVHSKEGAILYTVRGAMLFNRKIVAAALMEICLLPPPAHSLFTGSEYILLKICFQGVVFGTNPG